MRSRDENQSIFWDLGRIVPRLGQGSIWTSTE